ncbi:hypothetical protein [Streptomyces sp. NBC_01763]|uniref:hypothetical protein n=1 Tax=Streptomyces sp. NBC_01763 TaxID=2975934 RepID=UPI002DD7C83D|nr:hypothetical protein [Streptomyces sp. NBC_01763]WSC35659.1 hypothetical protein OHA08_09180 [Streptomyces sp. NBC_01763]
MNFVARALSFVHGVTCVFLAYAATVSAEQGAWSFATAFFGAAVLSGVAGCLGYAPETGTTRTGPCLGDPAEDLAVFVSTCTCDRWWTSFGTAHDVWCPNQSWSSST